jgi:hypothetical protein
MDIFIYISALLMLAVGAAMLEYSDGNFKHYFRGIATMGIGAMLCVIALLI